MTPTADHSSPESPRTPWRLLAVLTGVVVLAHLTLMALTSPAPGPKPSPLASTFTTRTIVVAPPAAPAAEVQAVPPVASVTAPLKPAPKPRTVSRPVAAPTAPIVEVPPQLETAGPDLTAQPLAETTTATPAIEPP